MTHVNITNLRKNLFDYVNQAVEYNDVINISTKNGNAVMISEEEYNSMMETLYLLSVPGMKEKLEEGLNARPEDCEEFSW